MTYFRHVAAVILLSGFAAGSGLAATFTFATSPNAKEQLGLDVSASATVTTSANRVSVTLTNLEFNPIWESQGLSGFFFSLSDNPTGVPNSVTPGAGTSLISIASNGAISSSNASVLAWTLTENAGLVEVESTRGGARQSIIGPGPYTTAQWLSPSSYNPYINQVATFTFSANGVTANTTVSNAYFEFGAIESYNVAASISGLSQSGTAPVGASPEPATIWLSLSAFSLFAWRARSLGRGSS